MIHPYGGLEQMKYGGYSKGLVKIDFKNIFFKKKKMHICEKKNKTKCIFVRKILISWYEKVWL